MQHLPARATALAAATLLATFPAIAGAQAQAPQPSSSSAPSSMSSAAAGPIGGPINDQQVTTLSQSLASLPQQVRSLTSAGTLSDAQIAIIPLGDNRNAARAVATLNASDEAALQKALGTVNVQRTYDRSASTSTGAVSLSDHLKSLGVDPNKVVAVSVAQGANPVVTFFVQGALKVPNTTTH